MLGELLGSQVVKAVMSALELVGIIIATILAVAVILVGVQTKNYKKGSDSS